MKVDFYHTNEQNAPTVEFYLFTKEVTQVINGEYIENDGQFYRVVWQTIPDFIPELVEGPLSTFPEREAVEGNTAPAVIVFLFPVSQKPIEIKPMDPITIFNDTHQLKKNTDAAWPQHDL